MNSSEIRNFPEEYVIDVCYEVVAYPDSVSADTEIKPIYLQDGTVDEQALADYDAFIDNIYASLVDIFDVADIEESPKSKTSWYFWIYGKSVDGDVTTKIIVRLRVSDHDYSERHSKKAEHIYVDKKAQELKRPSSKQHQRWKIRNITINEETYSSYEEAEDAIYEELEKLNNKLNNDG